MFQFVLCLLCLLVTHFKLAYQSQHHIDGSSGLKRTVLVTGAAQVSYGNFVADEFRRLQVSIGSSTTVMSYRECAVSCVNTPPCASFNVASSPDVAGKFRCELLNEDKYTSLNQLISSQEYHHFSIKTTCSSYPCKNNGKCVPNYGNNKYHCDCAPGYVGTHCETDIDECTDGSHDCHVKATCTNTVGSFNCICKERYTGDGRSCLDIDECTDNSHDCHVKATCTNTAGSFNCNCKAGYTGDGRSCLENWKKINNDPVCFGSRADSYGAFSISESGFIYTFKLTYRSGSVSCSKSIPSSYWGCTYSGYGDKTLMTVITSQNNDALSLAEYSGAGNNCGYYTFKIDGVGVNAKELLFNNLPSPLSVSTGQEFRIWFGEDLIDCAETNNSGETCADVYAWYA